MKRGHACFVAGVSDAGGRRSARVTDVWDLDQLRLPAERTESLESRRRPSRHRPGDPFIKGRFRIAGLRRPVGFPGPVSALRWPVRFLCCRFRSPNRWGLEDIANGLRISNRSAQRGFHAAELAGLRGRGTGAGLQAGRLRPGRPGAGRRAEASAVVRADPLGLVAPGLPAPGEFPSGRGGLLALGRLEPIGRFRAGVGRLGRVRPLPVLGLPGPG